MNERAGGASIWEIVWGLENLEVPTYMISEAIKLIPLNVRGLLVYGSRARGDAVAESDIDLLALVDMPSRSRNRGNVSLSFYTEKQLFSGIGSLFGAHLKRDARILYDPHSELARAIETQKAVDVPKLLTRVREFSVIFGSLDRDLPKYLPGLLREAKYLLRSALYANAISSGNECFSVRELAMLHRDTKLSDLLSSRPIHEALESDLYECIERLTEMVGPLPSNSHGSLESLIVNEWHPNSELISVAMLALSNTHSELEYIEFGNILL